MKKLVKCFLLLPTIILATSCDPGRFSFDLEELKNEVVSVELINYDNPKQKHFMSWVPDYTSKLKDLDLEKISNIEYLPNDKLDTFLDELSSQHILYKYFAFDSPKGLCIKLNYNNDDFDIVNCNVEKETFAGYIGKYISSGEMKEFYGCFAGYSSFESLVNNYFETKI